MDAKNYLESQDKDKIKEAAEFLRANGSPDCIDNLKKAKTTLPVYETAIISCIDEAIADIARRTAPAPTAAAAPAQAPAVPADGAAQAAPLSPADAQPAAEPQAQKWPDDAPPQDASGAPNGNGNGNGQPNEYLDKVKDMWEKGKTAAIKNATLLKLQSQLKTIKNNKDIQIKHLGEATLRFFGEKPSGIAFIDDQIRNVRALEAQIAQKQQEEKDLEAQKTEGGFWNVFKGSISKLAGYTKIKLDISIFSSNRESKIAAFGQIVHDKLAECECQISASNEICGILTAIRDLERQREEKEAEIAELSQQ